MAKKAFVYDGTQWVDIAQSTTDLTNYANMTTTPISGFRNAIINGDFRINQRQFTSVTANNTYGFDRWLLETNNGTCTYSSQAFTPGNAISGYEPTKHARLVTSGQTAANAYSIFEQRIEDVRTFAGQTVTISFWAKAASGTPKVAIEIGQNFGTGGSPSSLAFTTIGQVTLSTSWSRHSITFTVPSISGKTIGTTEGTSSLIFYLWVSAGTDFNSRTNSLGIQSNTFDFWGVQVEKGSIATPFEQRPIGAELALCQRYFLSIPLPATTCALAFGYVQSGTTNRYFVSTPVSMRDVTSVAETYTTMNSVGGSNQALTLSSTAVATTSSGVIIGGTVATAQTAPLVIFANNGTMTFDAEL